jgi:hypothetical protein
MFAKAMRPGVRPPGHGPVPPPGFMPQMGACVRRVVFFLLVCPLCDGALAAVPRAPFEHDDMAREFAQMHHRDPTHAEFERIYHEHHHRPPMARPPPHMPPMMAPQMVAQPPPGWVEDFQRMQPARPAPATVRSCVVLCCRRHTSVTPAWNDRSSS